MGEHVWHVDELTISLHGMPRVRAVCISIITGAAPVRLGVSSRGMTNHMQGTSDWAERVGAVFDTRPRVSINGGKSWIPRPEEELLANAIAYPGVHVCLDGPSGSGKTSLARTLFTKRRARGRHIYARLSNSTTWSSFKTQLVERSSSRKDADQGTSVKVGLKDLIPYLEFEGALSVGSLVKRAKRAEILEHLHIPEIADILTAEKLILAVDDCEQASDEMIRMLADLCKELSDRSTDSHAKLVLIGTNDIYRRLINANISIKGRIDEVTLCSVQDRFAGWKFITEGLTQLGLRNPDEDKFIQEDKLKLARDAVYDAADGLPKSIVQLGRTLGLRGESRTRVSFADIQAAAQDVTCRTFHDYRREYRALMFALRKKPELQLVCRWMFQHGVVSRHSFSEMAEDLRKNATYGILDDVVEALVDAQFLIRTGKDGDVFFARDPLLAHTLGVALETPAKVGADASFFGNGKHQLLLPFTSTKDPDHQAG